MRVLSISLLLVALTVAALAAPGSGPLKESLWREVSDAEGGIAKVEALVRNAESLSGKTLDREAGLRLADEVLSGFHWRERYVDSRHQQDLFKLKDLALKNGLRVLDWLWVRFTEHSHPYVRLHGIHRLGEVKAKEHAGRMAECLADPDPRVRMGAASALMAVKAGEYAASIGKLLEDQDEKVRCHAIAVLSDLSGRAMAPPMVKMLRDPSPEVRARAAGVLEELGAREALVELRAVRAAETVKYVADVLDAAIRNIESRSGEPRPVQISTRYSGPDSRYAEKRYMRVAHESTWKALWSRHAGTSKAPATDFGKYLVVAIFQGRKWNSRGVTAEITEDDRIVRVRFDDISYQTKGGADEVTPFGFFVIPKTSKTIVLEENTQGYIGYEPVWKERARLRP